MADGNRVKRYVTAYICIIKKKCGETAVGDCEVMSVERGREAKARRFAQAENKIDAEVVHVTMSMTRGQHRAIKRFALDNDTTASGLVQGWIDRYCRGQEGTLDAD